MCAASALLLLCQSVAVANACMLGMQPAADVAAEQPCHHTAQEPGQDEHGTHQAHCPSESTAASTHAKVSVPAAMDLPALTVRLDQSHFVAHTAPSLQLLTTHPDSPPLSILHCRLVI